MTSKVYCTKNDLPSDWEDDTRMNFLFSIFREKSVNPEGWDAKMNFWVSLVQELCLKREVPLINHSMLCSAFERKGRQPQCLDVVLDNMLSHGLVMGMGEFSKIEQEKGWIGWGFDVLFQKPVTWGLFTLQSVLKWAKKDERLIVIPVVKELAAKILQHHKEVVNSELVDNVMFLDVLEDQCRNFCSGMNFDLAIIELQRQKEVFIFEDHGRRIIKFRKREEKKVQPLTELDKGILGLRRAKDCILDDIDNLEDNILSCEEELKELVKTGCRTKAMLALKKKKRLEIVLKKKSLALDNIENLLYQLQNTGSEKMVLDAYRAGAQAIKSSVKEDLNLDKIDVTMAEVEETMDDYAEVQKTLSKSVTPDDESLEDFESELQEILAAENSAKPKEMKSSSPPKVSDDDLIRRLAALRAPPEGVPPVKKAALHQPLRT